MLCFGNARMKKLCGQHCFLVDGNYHGESGLNAPLTDKISERVVIISTEVEVTDDKELHINILTVLLSSRTKYDFIIL